MAEDMHAMHALSAWVLAGGEGRRVQGQDKGLLPFQGQPLVASVLACLAPQATHLGVLAKRHLDDYATLLQAACAPRTAPAEHRPTPIGVRPDDACWPEHSGPLAGILTALAHSPSDWLLVVPCDTPRLPADLLARLTRAIQDTQADMAIPCTMEPTGEARHHWVCALMHKRVAPTIEAAFLKGERKVRHAIGLCQWTSVSFADNASFQNFNTLETLYGADRLSCAFGPDRTGRSQPLQEPAR